MKKNDFLSFIKSKKQLIILSIYLLFLLLPNILLNLNIYYSFTASLINIFLGLSIYLGLMNLTNKVGRSFLLISPLVILNIYQLFLIYMFGYFPSGVDMFLNIVTSDTGEAGELLSSLITPIILVVLMIIFLFSLAFYSIRQSDSKLKVRYRKIILLSSIILLLPSIFLIYTEKRKDENYSVLDKVYPVNILYNLYLSTIEYGYLINYHQSSKDFRYNASSIRNSEDKELYIMVIGETSRAMNWSLYGYEKDTNPKLKTLGDKLIVYRDMFTQSNTTHKSVPIILSPCDAHSRAELHKTKGILSAYKEAGFHTTFISNQPPNGSYTDFFSMEADEYISLRNRRDLSGFDSDMLAILDSIIANSSKKEMIILHSYGSHFNYADRYPSSFSKFGEARANKIAIEERQRLVDTYDNAILFTDNFLYEIANRIEKLGYPANMLYISDHGEDLIDDERNRFLHAVPDISFYHMAIPFLIYPNEAYRAAYPDIVENLYHNSDKSFSSNQTFFTQLAISGITMPNFEDSRNLCKRKERGDSIRYYLDDHNKAVDIWTMTQSPRLDSTNYQNFRNKQF